MIDYLIEQLSKLGTIHHKRMFGADCLFLNTTMFAIIQDDDIFIKKHHIDKSDIRFSYYRKGKIVYLNYVQIDSSIIDEPDELIALIKNFLQ